MNLAVAGLAAFALVLAVTGALLRPDIALFGGRPVDASGNEVAGVSGRLPVSQSFPEDGFNFDRAAIDAVLTLAIAAPARPITIVTDANGNVPPTDPVRYAAPADGAEEGRQAQARVAPDQRAVTASVAPSVFNGSALVAEARRYLGTNPTRRATLWCGAFLDMVLRKTGYRGGGNLALAYARYGKRIAGPKVGAIVVLRRKGGGHVGIVTGVDGNGNPIVISGNHNRRVAISTYPRSRVVAYVIPQ
ncbi:MAG: TIGR02594 family protein [Xanthobacteraceae bacterium]|uniref:TIGR02594 family protein n=1 Tax=Pseudolabrys sp. TaxID=1960880 RepID=UPI003D0FE6FD